MDFSNTKWYQRYISTILILATVFELSALISTGILFFRHRYEIILLHEYHLICIPVVIFLVLLNRFTQSFIYDHEEFNTNFSFGMTLIYGILTNFNCLLLFNQIFILEGVSKNNDFIGHKYAIMKHSIGYYETNSDVKHLWDIIQTKHRCCGFFGVNDWPVDIRIPMSCYAVFNNSSNVVTNVLYKNGCGHLLNDSIKNLSKSFEKEIWNLFHYELIIMLGIVFLWIILFIKGLNKVLCSFSTQSTRPQQSVVNYTRRRVHDLPPAYNTTQFI